MQRYACGAPTEACVQCTQPNNPSRCGLQQGCICAPCEQLTRNPNCFQGLFLLCSISLPQNHRPMVILVNLFRHMQSSQTRWPSSLTMSSVKLWLLIVILSSNRMLLLEEAHAEIFGCLSALLKSQPAIANNLQFVDIASTALSLFARYDIGSSFCLFLSFSSFFFLFKRLE